MARDSERGRRKHGGPVFRCRKTLILSYWERMQRSRSPRTLSSPLPNSGSVMSDVWEEGRFYPAKGPLNAWPSWGFYDSPNSRARDKSLSQGMKCSDKTEESTDTDSGILFWWLGLGNESVTLPLGLILSVVYTLVISQLRIGPFFHSLTPLSSSGNCERAGRVFVLC